MILSKISSQGSALPWPNIIAFGVDAVTVPRAVPVLERDSNLAELVGKPHTLWHKRTLTTSGFSSAPCWTSISTALSARSPRCYSSRA